MTHQAPIVAMPDSETLSAVRGDAHFWHATLRSIGTALITVDTAGRITFANPAAEEITGWPVHSIVGQPLADIFTLVEDSGRTPILLPIERVLREGVEIHLTQPMLLPHRDGWDIAVESHCSPIFDHAGAPAGVAWVISDVRNKRRLEREFHRLSLLHAVSSRVAQAIIRTRTRGDLLQRICDICVAENAFETAWVTWKVADQERFEVLAHAGPGAAFVAGCADGMGDGVEASQFLLEAFRSGAPFTTHDFVSPHWAEAAREIGFKAVGTFPIQCQGGSVGLLVIHSNEQDFFRIKEIRLLQVIAEEIGYGLDALETADHRLAAERETEQVREQLIHSDRMATVGRLAAGVAHEINNPLGFVTSNLNILGEYLRDVDSALQEVVAAVAHAGESPLQDQAQTICARRGIDDARADFPALIAESRSGLDRVRRIVEGLRDFSGIDNGTWHEDDPNTLLDATLEFLATELGHCGIVRDYAPLPPLRCLSGQLSQAFMNILINAGQACAAGGQIKVRSYRDGDTIAIDIEDNGIGIAAADLPHIFEPFFTTRPVGTGAGLGLSVAWRIVELHHGRLWATVNSAAGSTFHVRLPLVADNPPAGASA